MRLPVWIFGSFLIILAIACGGDIGTQLPETSLMVQGEVTAEFERIDEVNRITGEGTLVSDLTYDLRSGSPDFLDKMIAYTFATMAVERISDGASGRMMAIQNGCYTDTEIPDPSLGARTVDVETMYNADRFRPNYANKTGLPIFLTRV